MDFKWLIVALLLLFGVIAYYRDDLIALGPTGDRSSELDSLNEKRARVQSGKEPSTKDWY